MTPRTDFPLAEKGSFRDVPSANPTKPGWHKHAKHATIAAIVLSSLPFFNHLIKAKKIVDKIVEKISPQESTSTALVHTSIKPPPPPPPPPVNNLPTNQETSDSIKPLVNPGCDKPETVKLSTIAEKAMPTDSKLEKRQERQNPPGPKVQQESPIAETAKTKRLQEERKIADRRHRQANLDSIAGLKIQIETARQEIDASTDALAQVNGLVATKDKLHSKLELLYENYRLCLEQLKNQTAADPEHPSKRNFYQWQLDGIQIKETAVIQEIDKVEAVLKPVLERIKSANENLARLQDKLNECLYHYPGMAWIVSSTAPSNVKHILLRNIPEKLQKELCNFEPVKVPLPSEIHSIVENFHGAEVSSLDMDIKQFREELESNSRQRIAPEEIKTGREDPMQQNLGDQQPSRWRSTWAKTLAVRSALRFH